MQVAISTRAGSGIGLAAARLLSRAGRAIAGVGRDKAKLQALETEVGMPGSHGNDRSGRYRA